MRNYFRMRGLWTTAHDGLDVAEFICWGGSDEQLMEHFEQMKAIALGSNPNYKFTTREPQVCWFELNQENFGRLLQGPFDNGFSNIAYFIWNNTRLNTSGTTPPANIGSFFYEMTQVEVQGSPRRTWSHGH